MSSVARPVINLKDYQLEQENAELRRIVKVLRHDIADLRAAAELWRRLYEDAQRRGSERESENVS